MTPTDPRHGTPAGYTAGCHDACCRAAITAYAKNLRTRQYLNGGPLMIDPVGTHRRIRALMALGWATTLLDTELGQARTYTCAVLQASTIHVDTAAKYRDLYDRLSMHLPPMDTGHQRQLASRTRNHAKKKRWAPPLAWDDIDNPAARPVTAHGPRPEYDPAVVERVLGGDWRMKASDAERTEIARRWYASGRSLADLERLARFKVGRYFQASDEEAA